MCKAMRGLQTLFYTRMIHVTCLAHGIHRLCEFIRQEFPTVNTLISKTKSVFLKAPSRKHLLKTMYPDLPLPPKPVVTRWGTWLEAAFYFADHFEEIKSVVNAISADEAQSVEMAQIEFNRNDIKPKLSVLKSSFSILPGAITKLEETGLSLKDSVSLVQQIVEQIGTIQPRKYHTKLEQVLTKNTGFQTLKTINSILNECTDCLEGEFVSNLTVSELAAYKYAPISSAGVERVFSTYKMVLDDRRRSFHFENLKELLVVHCNQIC